MASKATTVKEYLAALPDDRREALGAIRKVILANLDKPLEEGIQYGAIGYYLPHSVYPNGYHCDPKQPLPFAGLASNKAKISLHLFAIYGNAEHEAWLQKEWAKTGKKLDMGKACIRFKDLDAVPLDLIGRLFKRLKAKAFIAHYESAFGPDAAKPRKGARKTATKKMPAPKKKATSKKSS